MSIWLGELGQLFCLFYFSEKNIAQLLLQYIYSYFEKKAQKIIFSYKSPFLSCKTTHRIQSLDIYKLRFVLLFNFKFGTPLFFLPELHHNLLKSLKWPPIMAHYLSSTWKIKTRVSSSFFIKWLSIIKQFGGYLILHLKILHISLHKLLPDLKVLYEEA